MLLNLKFIILLQAFYIIFINTKKMYDEILNSIKTQLQLALSNYGITIALLIIGFTSGFFFKEYISDRHFRKQMDLRFEEKDEYVKTLKLIISERFSKIEVEKKDKDFVNRVKKFFKPKKK